MESVDEKLVEQTNEGRFVSIYELLRYHINILVSLLSSFCTIKTIKVTVCKTGGRIVFVRVCFISSFAFPT